MQSVRCIVHVHAGRAPSLTPRLQEGTAEEEANGVVGVALAPVLPANDDPQAECTIPLVSGVLGQTSNVVACEGLDHEQDDTIAVLATDLLVEGRLEQLHGGRQLDLQLEDLP